MAVYLRNLRKFSPAKISRYTVAFVVTMRRAAMNTVHTHPHMHLEEGRKRVGREGWGRNEDKGVLITLMVITIRVIA